MIPLSRFLMAAVIVQVGSALASSATDQAPSAAEPDYRVVGCVLDADVPLGISPVFRLAIVNQSEEHLSVGVVFDHDEAEHFQYPAGNVADDVRRTAKIRLFNVLPNQTFLDAIEVSSGPGKTAGEYTYQIDVCVGPKSGEKRDADHSLLPSDICLAFGLEVYRFVGTYTLLEPIGQQESYFKKYVEYGLENRTAEARARCRMLKDESEQAKALRDFEGEPFIDETEGFVPGDDSTQSSSKADIVRNIYLAHDFGMHHRLAANRPNRSGQTTGDQFFEHAAYRIRRANNGSYVESAATDSIANEIEDYRRKARQARFFSRISDAAWDPLLRYVVLGYFGTDQQAAGVEFVRMIADESPDCTVRLLARQLLELVEQNSSPTAPE